MHNRKRIITIALALYACLSMVIVFTSAGGEEKVSFVKAQNLPQLDRMDRESAKSLVEPLQVMQKIKRLKLTDEDLLYPQQNYETLYARFEGKDAAKGEEAVFEGDLTSELNRFLEANAGSRVAVNAPELTADEAIHIPDDTQLAGHRTRLVGEADIAIELQQAKNVSVSGFEMNGGFGYGVYAIDGENISVSDCDFVGLRHKPVVFMGECKGVVLKNNSMRGNLEGGAYFNGGIENVLIENNEITDNLGTSNWMAGLVLTAIDVVDKANVYAAFREDLHFPAEQRLDSMLQAPHDVIVRNNRVCRNNSSGVYCDGPYRVYVVENRIEENDKEGMCLDYGTVGVYVAENDIIANGNRGRQTDDDLRMDFMLEAGRMADGSARAKLPGISIDNAAYNIIYSNRVSMNYGSGVKMVRTGVRNIISTNLIVGNNRGVNDSFHFFGVEMGSARADVAADNLDFTADYENVISRNIISGAHYAGVFLDVETYMNDIIDNSIFDATDWSMECLSDMPNSCLNNYSEVASRGIALTSSVAISVAGMVAK